MREFFWRVAPDCPPSIATRRNTPRDLPLTSKKPSVWGGADLQKFTKKLAPSKVKKCIYYTISPQKTFISRRGGLKIKIQGKGDFWPPPPHPPPLDGRWRGKTKRKEEGRERREKKGGKGSKKGVRGGHLQKKSRKNQQQQQQVYPMIIRLQIHAYIERKVTHFSTPFLISFSFS